MKKFLLFWASVISMVHPNYAADWYVKPGGSGSGNSCTNAASVNSLQTVINAAAAGDVINLEPGNYTMTNSVNINKQLTIKGAGMGRTIVASGASALSPFAISAAGVIFRDMTIKDFSGTTSNAKAFYIKGTTGNELINIEFTNFPTGNVSEIVIVENVNAAGSAAAVGVTFDGCWWHGMVAGSIRSQGIAIRSKNTTSAINVTVQNCIMTGMDNTNDHFPAGIYLAGVGSGLPATCNLTATNSVFSCLTGERGGAIGVYPSSGSNYPTVNITNCTFNNNTNPNTNGAEGGGALDFQRGGFITIDKCIFDGNSQTGSGSRGGAINMDNTGNIRMTVSNCIFRNNTSTGPGSAIYFEDLHASFSHSVSNCLFHNNQANGGSTVTVAGSTSPTLNLGNCTFTDNKGSSSTAGHVLRVNNGTVTLSNSISYDNWTDGEDELSQSGGTAAINTVNLEGASVATAESTELGGTWTKSGTFITDPVFDSNYEPTTSGYPATVGFRYNSLSIGGSPGDYDEDPGGSCPSRGFNFPNTTSLCILPVTDSGSASASGGTAIANVAANDQVNGAAATLGAGGNAAVSTSGSWPSGITLNTTTGAVEVANGTTQGIYTLEYNLCDKLTPPTCVTISIEVTVTAPLPVELTRFDAQIKGKTTLLIWATASEYQNSHFDIERSINGHDWTIIGTMPSQNGISDTDQIYEFNDEYPVLNRPNYYRLAQMDQDGNVTYSPIRLVRFERENTWITAYPNPVKDQLRIAISDKTISEINIEDMTGRRVYAESYEAAISPTLQIGGISAGLYRVGVIFSDGETGSVLILVQP